MMKEVKMFKIKDRRTDRQTDGRKSDQRYTLKFSAQVIKTHEMHDMLNIFINVIKKEYGNI